MSLSCALPEAEIVKEEEEREEDDEAVEEIDKRSKIAVLDERDSEFDVLGVQKFIWTDLEGEYSLLGDDKKEIILKQNGDGWIAEFYDLNGSSRKIFENPLPLPYAQGCAEDFARKHLTLKFADSNAGWMQAEEPPTQGQRDLLEKLGAWSDNFTKVQAAIEIRKQLAFKSKRRREMLVRASYGCAKMVSVQRRDRYRWNE